MNARVSEQIARNRSELEEVTLGRKPAQLGRILAAGFLLLSYHMEDWFEWVRDINAEEEASHE